MLSGDTPCTTEAELPTLRTNRASSGAEAGMPNKRLAQSKLVRMVLNKGEALA
jgi:hypothetical protein